MTNEEKIVRCARAAHNVFAVYCKMIGDFSIKEWDDAPEWQRQDTIAMVESTLRGQHSPAEEHGRWVKSKVDRGYIWGAEKNDDKDSGPLTNPNILPYRDLPLYQQLKDPLLMIVALAVASHYGLPIEKHPDLVFTTVR